MITEETIALAQILWDYHHTNHQLKKSDCILALGSHDLRVAERAAQLYLEGWSPLLIFSGGFGRLTAGAWKETEAERFAAIAIEMGVQPEGILIEKASTNTGENILFTQQLLHQKKLNPHSFIVVQKPYMERRSLATFNKQWPDKEVIVTSPQNPFIEYATEEIPMDKVINIMVGDLQRIREYPKKGFQTEQYIPGEVWNAYDQLVADGFDNQLIK